MHDPGPAAAILAGGHARRLNGLDKSRLLVHGRPIIFRQLEVLQRLTSRTFIVGRNPERFADTGLEVYADHVTGIGAIGGILTAIEVAAPSPVIVVGNDQPFLQEAVLRALIALAAAPGVDGAWVRTTRGPEPLLACYAARAAAPLRAAIDAGLRRAGDLGQVLALAELAGPPLDALADADRLLTNVNTPDDLRHVQ